MTALPILLGVLTVSLGGWVGVFFLRDAAPPTWLRLIHGTAGGLTLALAALALAGSQTTTPFQWDAVGLLALAFALGLLLLLAWAPLGRQRGMVALLHGFAGMAGAALLASLFLG